MCDEDNGSKCDFNWPERTMNDDVFDEDDANGCSQSNSSACTNKKDCEAAGGAWIELKPPGVCTFKLIPKE